MTDEKVLTEVAEKVRANQLKDDWRCRSATGAATSKKTTEPQRAMAAVMDDDDKPPLDLLPWESLIWVAEVVGYDAEKYGRHGWRRGMRWGGVLADALYHLGKWATGETLDPESGLPHLAHAACCVLYLLSCESRMVGEDDR